MVLHLSLGINGESGEQLLDGRAETAQALQDHEVHGLIRLLGNPLIRAKPVDRDPPGVGPSDLPRRAVVHLGAVEHRDDRTRPRETSQIGLEQPAGPARAGRGGRVTLRKIGPMAAGLEGAAELLVERLLGVGEERGGEVDVQPAVT